MDEKQLPSFCKDHPNAQILHEWDKTIYNIRGGEQGNPINDNHRYYCSKCRTEVCSQEEFDKRSKNGTATVT